MTVDIARLLDRRGALLIAEALRTLLSQPTRTIVAALAIVLGVGLMLLTWGLSTTIERQVAADFDALRATFVLVRPVDADVPDPGTTGMDRLSTVSGVVHSGHLSVLEPVTVTSTAGASAVEAPLVEASAGALRSVGAEVSTGRLFDRWHASSSAPVALIGASVADALGLTMVDGSAAIEVGQARYTVMGVIAGAQLRPSLTDAIVLPGASVPSRAGSVVDIVIRTTPGAAADVAAVAPAVLSPLEPEAWQSSAPPDPDTLRSQIEGGVRAALFSVSVAVILIALLSIANASYVSVLERRPQLGVRRALGATPRDIAFQVLLEAGLVGLVGGVAGTSLAVIVLVGIAASLGTAPVLSPAAPMMSIALGLAAGLASGLFPARYASRIEPSAAIRTG